MVRQGGDRMSGTAAKIRESEKQLVVLSELRRSRTAAKGVVQRASIIELGFRGLRNVQIVDHVKLNRQQVGVWRQRWRDAWEALCVWESHEPHRLREGILEVLSDAPRPGSPGGGTLWVHRRASRSDCGPGMRVAEVVGSSDQPLDAQRTAGRGGQTPDRVEHLGRAGGPRLAAGGAAAAALEAVAHDDGEERRQVRARARHGLPDVSRCSAPGRARRDSHGERGRGDVSASPRTQRSRQTGSTRPSDQTGI